MGSYGLLLMVGGIAGAAGAPTTFGRREMKMSTSFVHHQHQPLSRLGHAPPIWQTIPVPVKSGHGTVLRATNDDESMISDPLDHIYDESLPLPSQTSSSSTWGIGDDWSELSSDNPAANAFASPSSSSNSISGNYNVMEDAARILQEQEQILSQWDSSSDSTSDGDAKDSSGTYVKSAEDDFVENAVEMISIHSDYNEPGDEGVQLYDTISSSVSPSTQEVKDNQDEAEIAFMIRCNQSPEQLLIEQGRALPELTEEEKYSASFLLEEQSLQGGANNSEQQDGSSLSALPLQPKLTPFFEQAIQKIYDTHAVQVEEEKKNVHVLDRQGLSKWMTKCITSPLATSKQYTIGPYDPAISATLSRYSHSHGSGRLTLEEFQALYLEVAWSGYIRDIIKKKTVLDITTKDGEGRGYHIPSANAGVLIHGKKNTEKMLKQATLSLIWRDLEAHEIFSPVEEERVQQLLELERLQASLTTTSSSNKHAQLLMDECELFDEYEDRLSHQTYSEDNDSDMLGEERAWDFLKERKEKSSHELVDMASDGKTPKRIRDGQFVFIDEESCIGCTQCAQIAPSTFKMIEESGRARTFFQRNSQDVENAVMACPVSCMHNMSFDELKEMESSRDDGDGRTDHRHFGSGRSHTPLYVRGIDSDANHKSSWYHYLKWKCHGSSCPQRGCYDCPQYAPGENPFFIERHNKAEHIRAKDFMESGEADKWRKVVEL